MPSHLLIEQPDLKAQLDFFGSIIEGTIVLEFKRGTEAIGLTELDIEKLNGIYGGSVQNSPPPNFRQRTFIELAEYPLCRT
jgi:hypothetical protein